MHMLPIDEILPINAATYFFYIIFANSRINSFFSIVSLPSSGSQLVSEIRWNILIALVAWLEGKSWFRNVLNCMYNPNNLYNNCGEPPVFTDFMFPLV